MINTKNEKLYLVFILCLCFLLVSPVFGATYEGSLGSEGSNYTYYTNGAGTQTSNTKPLSMMFSKQVETSGRLTTVVNFFASGSHLTTDAGSPSGATTSCIIRELPNSNTNPTTGIPTTTNGAIRGTCSIGYQKIYSSATPPVLTGWYLYANIYNWNVSGLTGDKYFYLEYNQPSLYNVSVASGITTQYIAQGLSSFANPQGGLTSGGTAITLSNLKDVSTAAIYSVTDGGIGVTGNISKTVGLSQALVFSSTGAILASQDTLSLSSFPFTVLNQNIFVSIKDSRGILYNSSVMLFGAPIVTPTYINASVTPTVIPPFSNIDGKNAISITINDALNNTPISGVTISITDLNDAASGWFNVTAAQGNYVFGGYGAGGAKPFVIGHQYAYAATKTGYTPIYAQMPHPRSGLAEYITAIMYPSVYLPSASKFSLSVILFDQSTSTQVGSVQGTVKLTNQSSAWTSTVTNPVNNAAFGGLNPNGDSFKIDVNIIGYQQTSEVFSSSSAMGNTFQTYLIYLTPINALPSTYTLSVSPATGTLNDTYTASITGDISNAVSVVYKARSSSRPDFSMLVGSYYSEYRLISGAWKIWDGSAWQASSLPQSISVKLGDTYSLDASYTITAYITTASGNTYTAYDTIAIISAGVQKAKFQVWDGSASFTALSNYNLYVKNLGTETWTNKTLTFNDYAIQSYVSFDPNTNIQYYASASGYTTSPITSGYIGNSDVTFDINLYPVSSLPVGNVTLYVNVRNTQYLTLPNVRVNFSDSQTCYTNNNGQCSITAINGSYYSATATAPAGYLSATGGITTSGIHDVIYLTLLATSITTNPYASTTGGGVGYVTSVPTYNIYTPNSTTGASCAVTLGGNATVKDQLMNYIACNGVTTKEGQNAMLALVIMLFSAAVLGKYAKGLGAITGVIAGAAISFYLALLPFWIMVFVCICAGVVFSAKIFGSGK